MSSIADSSTLLCEKILDSVLDSSCLLENAEPFISDLIDFSLLVLVNIFFWPLGCAPCDFSSIVCFALTEPTFDVLTWFLLESEATIDPVNPFFIEENEIVETVWIGLATVFSWTDFRLSWFVLDTEFGNTFTPALGSAFGGCFKTDLSKLIATSKPCCCNIPNFWPNPFTVAVLFGSLNGLNAVSKTDLKFLLETGLIKRAPTDLELASAFDVKPNHERIVAKLMTLSSLELRPLLKVPENVIVFLAESLMPCYKFESNYFH